MPVHVKDTVLGPAAEAAARALYETDDCEPDLVIVIYSKTVAPNEGRTAVGTASARPVADDVVAKVIRYAGEALLPKAKA